MNTREQLRLRQAWRRAEDECTRLREHNESLKEALMEKPYPDEIEDAIRTAVVESIVERIHASEAMHWNDRLIAASIARSEGRRTTATP
jgi:hypothetical protein